MCVAIPPLPQYAFIAWCLVKHRDNFTFTPRIRVIPKKLTVTHLVNKIHTSYGALRFITMFKRAQHWSLTSARCNQFILSHSKIYYNIIFSFMPKSFQWSLPFRSSDQSLNAFLICLTNTRSKYQNRTHRQSSLWVGFWFFTRHKKEYIMDHFQKALI
jgi:hypothetical protein